MEMGRRVPAAEEPPTTGKKVATLLLNIATNPVIFMTVAGVAGNLAFRGSLPAVLSQFLGTLGSAFSASALFFLGLRMVGRRGGGSGDGSGSGSGSGLVVAAILIVVKTVALPIISREIMSSLRAGENHNETENLANFAFLYGTFPTAPTVFVFAAQYDVLPELTANAMVACTFVAAP
jgi:predicted permease